MAVDKLVDSTQLDADLTTVANAIRAKGGTSAQLSFPAGMAQAIADIQTGITPTGSININENGTYDVTDKASAVVNVGSSLPIELVLVGEETVALEEYTDTTTNETTTTTINISNTDYVWFITTIECDGTAEGNNDWGGLTVAIGGRYKSNRKYFSCASCSYKGTKVLSFADLLSPPSTEGAYGVCLLNNTTHITFSRKCHESACPKIMGGNYTIRTYAITGV